MAVPNVGGPGQTDGQPIRMTGNQVGGKGSDGNFHIFSTDNSGFLNVNTTGGGGGGGGTVTQGPQGTIPASWFVELTNGTVVLGTPSNPLRIDPTGTTIQPVSGTVSITGTIANNMTQWAGTVLGTPTAFGTTPGAVVAGSVNASLFSGTTALTNTGGALNVNLTGGTVTITGAVTGNKSNNSVVPGSTNLGVLPGIANAATQTWTEGDQVLESMDLSGRQRIRGILTPNTAAPSSDGQMTITALANAVAPSYTEGNLVLHSVDLSGNTRIIGTRINNNAAPSFNVAVLPALANAVNPSWTEGNQVTLSETLTGYLRVTTDALLVNVVGAAAADAAATGNPVLVAGVDGSGNVQEFPVADQNTVAPSQVLVTGGVFNANTGTTGALTAGNVSSLQLDNHGLLLTDVASLAGIALGPTAVVNYGSTPAAVAVPAVNAFITNTPTVTLASTTITGTSAFNLTQWASTVLGTPTAFGTTPGAVVAGSVNSSLFIGTVAAVAAAAGVQKVGITGNSGASLDTSSGVGAPTNFISVGGTYGSTAPLFFTNGSAARLQQDSAGDVFVRPYRRSQVVRQATTISNSSGSTTVLAAQAASVFADISNLIITVTPGATTDLAFTATLSDGTVSYIFDMDTGALLTSVASPSQINVNFNPPLPATTAATAWTIALSAALSTSPVHITVVAVIGLAN